MLLDASKALNTRHIRYCVDQITIAFWSGATLEAGMANQARRFRSGP